ncbi:MAG: hypothetical protein KIT36_17605 [Alphaproteobacteria bacterium]|nr:hypothetical protein [Alphaproteobacteria bacterium]
MLPALAGSASAADPLPPNTLITLQRGACEKRCAVYKVVVFADGTVVYDGQYYVRKSGVVRDKVDVGSVAKLITEFEAAGFFDLADQYGYLSEAGCTSMLSDGPVAIVSVVSGAKAKSVVHNHRCVGDVPAQLTRLEASIDKLANTARWIR